MPLTSSSGTTTCMKVNYARRDLFTRKGRDIESIPPTSDNGVNMLRGLTYQAGYCWGNLLVLSSPFPCPSEWGWLKLAGLHRKRNEQYSNYICICIDINMNYAR